MKKIIMTIPFSILIFWWSSFSRAESTVVDYSSTLQGVWQIQEVHINSLQTYRPDIITNDPTLVGRTITFTKNDISGDILVSMGCGKPEYAYSNAMKFDELIKKTSGSDGSSIDKISAKSYGFSFAGDTVVQPVTVSCSQGILGPRGHAVDNWLVETDNNTMITNWDSDSYLTLKKLSNNPQPDPGFTCASNNNDAERAICASYELSSWDRSVSDAYKTVLKQIINIGDNVETKVSKLKAAQLSWLHERNRCASDSQCLKSTMRKRTESLVDQAK
ncbi:lysozyme inhibitor LprI family protein [Erwinia sp. HDF1-3R]|uniref:lysozyme inhibitor LprI family protein n=1 Tax=Erwinia sp. HDF1-3R TaxID=3141543 RepID=UPI0031F5CB09